jgi:hypothetical protein
MPNDGSVEIRITGAVDRSLESSTQQAIAQLGRIADAADQQSAAGTTAANWVQATGEIRAAYEKLGLDIAAVSKGIEDDSQNSARQTAAAHVKAWEDANRAIEASESTLVRDIFSKHQSLNADLLGIARQLVEQELSSDLKYWTERGLLAVEGIENEKTAEQGGAFQKLIFDQLKTTSTATSQAAQSAAVSAGVATRTAVQSAGDAQGLAAHAAAASLTISNDAAQAAAGAYASASQVPLIGWLLGPVAAVGAFGAVMAYDSIASAEGGQWKVGGGEQLTALHKDEMVWPGWAAHGARNMLESFSVGGRAQGGDAIDRSSATSHQWNYAPTIHGVPERNIVDELRNSGAEFVSFIRGMTRNGSLQL